MTRADFNWLPDSSAGHSGTVPVEIRRVERQDDIAGRHRETGREALQPERGESQGFIEDVLFAPQGVCAGKTPKSLPVRLYSGRRRDSPPAWMTRTRLRVHHAGSHLPRAWRARSVAPPLPMRRPSGSETTCQETLRGK